MGVVGVAQVHQGGVLPDGLAQRLEVDGVCFVQGNRYALRVGERTVHLVHHEGRPWVDEVATSPAQCPGGGGQQFRAAGAEPDALAGDVGSLRQRLGQIDATAVRIPVDARRGGGYHRLDLGKRGPGILVGSQLDDLPDPVPAGDLLYTRATLVWRQGLDLRTDTDHPLTLPAQQGLSA